MIQRRDRVSGPSGAPRSVATLLPIALAILLPACATLQEIAALRRVDFAFDRITDVTLAGVRLESGMRYSDLGVADAARIVSAVQEHRVPLAFSVHVRAENPPDNTVTARLEELAWTFFIEERRTFAGVLDQAYPLPPGTPVDVPLRVRVDLDEFFTGAAARDLFDIALSIAGLGGRSRELRLELRPTIETSIGPIQYPEPVVIRRST